MGDVVSGTKEQRNKTKFAHCISMSVSFLPLIIYRNRGTKQSCLMLHYMCDPLSPSSFHLEEQRNKNSPVSCIFLCLPLSPSSFQLEEQRNKNSPVSCISMCVPLSPSSFLLEEQRNKNSPVQFSSHGWCCVWNKGTEEQNKVCALHLHVCLLPSSNHLQEQRNETKLSNASLYVWPFVTFLFSARGTEEQK